MRLRTFTLLTLLFAMFLVLLGISQPTEAANEPDKPIATASVIVTKGELINVVALGEAAGKGVAALRLATFPAYGKDLAGGAAVDVIHAVPDGPAVDLLSGVRPVVKNVAF